MVFDIVFLGTSCMVPTAERNHPGLFISYNGNGMLFDCGENIQRQIKVAKIKPSQITKIFISHWHGDHVLGLPGLLQTMSSSESTPSIDFYGPKGSKEYFFHMFKAFIFDNKINLKITEIDKNEIIYENSDFSVEAFKLDHRVPTHGFRIVEKDKRKINIAYLRSLGIEDGPHLADLQRGKDIKHKNKIIKAELATKISKGKIIGIIMDTAICNNCYKIAQDADLLISEATYVHELKEKAEEYKHITSREAAQIASQSNAKKLILTHLSQRYKNSDDILEDATMVFKDTIVAFDLMKTKI